MISEKAEEIIARAVLEGVTLSVVGPDRLRYQVRGRPLSTDLKALILEHKTAILAALAPAAPLEVDGVTVVVCTTYPEAEALIAEMLADAAGKPVALDLETAPICSERERLAQLIAEQKKVNDLAIAFRAVEKKEGTPQAEIDAYTAKTNARLKILGAKIEYAESAGLDPNRATVRLLQLYGGGTRAAVIDVAKTGAKTLKLLQGVSAVIHNAVFDLAFLQHRGVTLGKVHDTQQAAKLTVGASKCSLARAVKYYLKADLDKDLQASDWSAPELSAEQLTYAARDVIWLWRLCPPLFKDLGPQVSAYRIQAAAAPAIARLNTAGIAIDLEKHAETLRALAEQDAIECAGYQDACRAMGKPELAEKVPRTDAEIAAFLKAVLSEDELSSWRRIDKPWQLSTARAELLKAVHYAPVAPLAALSQIKGLRLSFGEPLRYRVSPVTGRVHPRYTIAGSPPGRSSCSEPNIQGAPKDARIRGVFKAADGYVLVAADYHCMELRAAAYFFGDQQLIAVFERGEDPHKLTASRVTGRPVEDIADDDADRSKSKAVNFGSLYGIGGAGLVAQIWKNFRLVISLNDAENLIAGFTSLYSVLVEHRRDYAAICQARGKIVIGPCWREGKGRVVPLDRLPEDQSTLTCAYSYPIQGGCADVAMIAIAAVDRRLLEEKINARLVGSIHDELIVEAREADVDRVKAILQSEMEQAFIDIFPAATRNKLIEVKVAPNWAAVKAKNKPPAIEERQEDAPQPPAPAVQTKSSPRQLRAADLYCCAGGASHGLQSAGFHVTGVDINPQPNYCGDVFIQADVLALDPAFLADFDFVHASPPCQALSSMRHVHNAKQHLNLIPATRALLKASGKPYVIENVEGAREWLIDPILLCGTMFNLRAEGRELQRHRLFETSFPITAPPCRHSGGKVLGVYGGHVRDRQRPQGLNHVSGSNLSITVGREAMGMPWATGQELSEAIPPAYAEYIARQFLQAQAKEQEDSK